MLENRISRIAIGVSLLLHVALTAPLWQRGDPLASGSEATPLSPRAPAPMEIRLVDPQEGPDARPDAPTPNVSDADRRAAQPDAPEDLPRGEAYNEGQTPLPSTPRPAGARARAAAPPPQAAASAETRSPERGADEAQRPPRNEEGIGDPGARVETRPGGSDPRLALGPTRIGARPQASIAGAETETRPGSRLPAPEVDQRLTRAEAGSSFTLNTTAWEWAPYMQRLKARIEEHISPPAAFYYGTAAWISRVRFRIGPDGRLLDFRLLDHRGVENLQYVALDAITGGADYEPLPPGFPEPYLEITGNFYFNVFPPDGQ